MHVNSFFLYEKNLLVNDNDPIRGGANMCICSANILQKIYKIATMIGILVFVI